MSVTTVVLLCGTACGQSAEISATPSPSLDESSQESAVIAEEPLRAAYERIPFASGAYPSVEEFPDDVLLAHLDCTAQVTDGKSPGLSEATFEVSVLYSNCAIESGVTDYADVWRPSSQAEEADLLREADREMRACLESAGFDEDLPTFESAHGPLLDVDALIAQDPTVAIVLDNCFADSEHPEE